MTRTSPLVLAALLLGGCTVGPQYRQPVAAASDQWLEGGSLAPVDTRWWDSFGDPELSRLVALTIAHNPDLREAQARLAEARADREAAAGGALPAVNATGSATRNRVSENGQLPVANIPGFQPRFSLYDIGFDASWELDLWGRSRRTVEGAAAREAAAEWSRRDVLVSLVAEVARNYVDLRRAQADLAEVRATAAGNARLARLTELRFRAGEDDRLTLDRAESARAASAQSVAEADATAAATAYRIAGLVGVAPEEIVPALRASEADLPAPPASIAMGVRSDLLRRRADIRRAERELAGATADVGVATADLFPRFSLLGNLGQQARTPGDLLSGASTRFSIGPSFSWPIFSGGRVRAQIRAAGARSDAAAARYDKAVVTALSDSEAAANRFARSASAEQQAGVAEREEAAAFALAELRARRGEDDRLVLERARLRLTDARRRLLQARADHAAAAISLYKALGGGWDVTESTTPTPRAATR